MRAVHVVPSITDPVSGPAYSVPALCESLAQLPVEVTLHVLAPGPDTIPPDKLRIYPAWPILKRLGISPAMRRGLREAAKNADILHSHSLWMMPNLYPAAAVLGTNCRLVVSPRGTLQDAAWNRSRFRKRIMWALGQKKVLTSAACLVATGAGELAGIRARGLTQPVALIPNGIAVPPPPAHARAENGTRRLLFLGRIHPIKGLENLLQAWSRIERDFGAWELCFTGTDEAGYVDTLRTQAKALKITRFDVHRPVFGEDKGRMLRDADLLILPSFSENFGVVVAEALAHGVPVIASKSTPWQGLTNHGCGWWTENTPDALEACLREALALPREALRQMGASGRQWMLDEFSWPRIGRMTLDTYSWLLGNAPKPAWVEEK